MDFRTRASIGMDVVIVGLVLLLPILLSASWQENGRYRLHKSLQIFIMAALLAAILLLK